MQHTIDFTLDTPRSRNVGNRCAAPPAEGRCGESRVTDETTPTRRAKPAGVIGAEMIRAATVRERFFDMDGPPLTQRVSLCGTDRRAITERSSARCVKGPPPVDPGELTFLAVDTRAPYTRDYDGAQGSKPAHYMLRWVNSRGEVGPWSATVTATIGA